MGFPFSQLWKKAGSGSLLTPTTMMTTSRLDVKSRYLVRYSCRNTCMWKQSCQSSIQSNSNKIMTILGGGDPTRGADVQLAEERACPAELRAYGHHPDGPRHLPGDHKPGHHRPQVHRLRHLHLCGGAEGRRHPGDQHWRQHLIHNWWASHPFVSVTHLHPPPQHISHWHTLRIPAVRAKKKKKFSGSVS